MSAVDAPDDVAQAEGLTAREKRFSTLQAQLALRGHAVHHLATGGFLVVLGGYTRHFIDLDGLEAFARQVGAVE